MQLDELIAHWEPAVPAELKADVMWRYAAYRLAVFASDYVWPDVTALAGDPRTIAIAPQLFRAIGSISSNFAEAYSRGSDRDRCRIYEYALGSARESREWVFKSRHVIGADRSLVLMSLLTRIIQLLTVTIVRERARDSRLGRTQGPSRRSEATRDPRFQTPDTS
jgi:four helix bundle protein